MSNVGAAVSSILPEIWVRSSHSPGMTRLTSVDTYRPLPVSVNSGTQHDPCPMAGIHGVTARVSPSTGAPVVASVIMSTTPSTPAGGGCVGVVYTATFSLPESLIATGPTGVGARWERLV